MPASEDREHAGMEARNRDGFKLSRRHSVARGARARNPLGGV